MLIFFFFATSFASFFFLTLPPAIDIYLSLHTYIIFIYRWIRVYVNAFFFLYILKSSRCISPLKQFFFLGKLTEIHFIVLLFAITRTLVVQKGFDSFIFIWESGGKVRNVAVLFFFVRINVLKSEVQKWRRRQPCTAFLPQWILFLFAPLFVICIDELCLGCDRPLSLSLPSI